YDYVFIASPPHTVYTLALHDALPIYGRALCHAAAGVSRAGERNHQSDVGASHSGKRRGYDTGASHFSLRGKVESGSSDSSVAVRSEEHTSELQSRFDLVCRLLLEKKK